jgi:hypothetical protein
MVFLEEKNLMTLVQFYREIFLGEGTLMIDITDIYRYFTDGSILSVASMTDSIGIDPSPNMPS